MPDEDLYDEEQEDSELGLNERKKLERLLAKAEKAQAEADARAQQAERKLVVAQAGLQLTQRQLDALEKVHDGEWTAQALTATATELGFVQPPRDETPDLELAEHRKLSNATAGGDAAPPSSYVDELKAASTQEEVMAIAERYGRMTSYNSS